MRVPLILFLAGTLVACSPDIPDSGRGIGFDTSSDALQAQNIEGMGGMPIPEATVSGERIPAPPVIAAVELPSSPPVTDTDLAAAGLPVASPPAVAAPVFAAPVIAAAPQTTDTILANAGAEDDIAAETAAALAASAANSGVAPVIASPSNPPPAQANNPGLSRENDFASVSNARSIEGDAERIARNRQQYQLIQPTALPTREGKAGPNIVTYALQTSHERGTKLYTRIGLNLPGHAQRACGRYPSPDQAQIDFLSTGGPERDKLGLDPDGDGFACAWNPAPFRTAVKK